MPYCAQEIVDPIECFRLYEPVLNKLAVRRDAERNEIISMGMKKMSDLLELTAQCSEKSEIERLMALHLRAWIDRQGCPGKYQLIPQYQILVDNKMRYIDFLIIREDERGTVKLAIECDGKGHEDAEVKAIDERKDESLEFEYGILTLRFKGHHIYQYPERCIFRIANAFKVADLYGRRLCD